jgi:hypothetical protein
MNSIESTWQKIKHGVTFPKFGAKSEHLDGMLAEYHWRAYVGDEQERFFEFLSVIKECYNGNCGEATCKHGCTLAE